jgi:hypothetical protein
MSLQGLERRLEAMVDGVFGRAFRSSVKPIELGRRLVRDMDALRTVDVQGRTVVPNAFTFRLGRDDHERYRTIREALIRELVDVAHTHAADEGYAFLGPVVVTIDVDDSVRTGRFGLDAALRDVSTFAPAPAAVAVPRAPVAAPVVEPPVAPPVAAPPPLRRVLIELPTGDRRSLPFDRSITIGRSPDGDVVLPDPSVSRNHARIQPLSDGWLLLDLASTNGTTVNGRRIDGPQRLQVGDEITVGTVRLRVVVG